MSLGTSPRAFVLYQRACDSSDMSGCNNLGFLYQRGAGVTQDLDLAVSLFQQACDGGNMNGCNNLGVIYPCVAAGAEATIQTAIGSDVGD